MENEFEKKILVGTMEEGEKTKEDPNIKKYKTPEEMEEEISLLKSKNYVETRTTDNIWVLRNLKLHDEYIFDTKKGERLYVDLSKGDPARGI